MIKGVNKQIVEINCTRDEYIERAILFVNPQKATLPRDILEKKASEYLNSLLPIATGKSVHDTTIPLLKSGNRKLNRKRKLPLERFLIAALIACCVIAAVIITIPFWVTV